MATGQQVELQTAPLVEAVAVTALMITPRLIHIPLHRAVVVVVVAAPEEGDQGETRGQVGHLQVRLFTTRQTKSVS